MMVTDYDRHICGKRGENSSCAWLVTSSLGRISKTFNAGPPFTLPGRFARAWDMAKLLRAWSGVSK